MSETVTPSATEGEAGTVVIVGAGHAGGRAALQLRRRGHAGRVVMIGAEAELPYERPPLSKGYLKGTESAGDMALRPAEDWATERIEHIAGATVTAIDPAARAVELADGRRIGFDHAICATGGRARALPVPGADALLGLRDLADAAALRARLAGARRLVVVGGGVIGLEVAATACALGCAVTVLEAGPRVMARILPPEASDWLAGRHAAAGVEIRTGVHISQVVPLGDGSIVVETGAGPVAADLGLYAIGIVPEAGLVRGARVGASGGLATDAFCRVEGTEGRVFAIGDIAETPNPVLGRPARLETWRNAETQAAAVAATLCGTPTQAQETPWMWTDQLGHNIQVVGAWEGRGETLWRGAPGAPGSVLFWLEGARVRGAVLIDAGREKRFVEGLVAAGTPVDPAALADPAQRLKALLQAPAAAG
ncbi:NAD(P)/FAD-dependent oxidoreductase [Oceanicella sp. SM1341]|uniref:NAD(P)/FAD-dependent oxidoreductase n=1 Tax=Oceanicella sp. SM1341 TaxID=1548889 RepID=UPI000E46CF04|nr:FAD-dependent oxidoreductase [Oceanicella sp. SM1341]